MAKHPDISEDMIRHLLQASYGNVDSFSEASIAFETSGKASVGFYVSEAGNTIPKYFGKISHSDNGKMEAVAMHEASLHGIPCPEVLTGNSSHLWEAIPRTALSEAGFTFPDMPPDASVRLFAYVPQHSIEPERLYQPDGSLTDTGRSALQAIGRFEAELGIRLQRMEEFLPDVLQTPEYVKDTKAFHATEKKIINTLQLAQKPVEMPIEEWWEKLADKLDEDRVSKDFAGALRAGNIGKVVTALEEAKAALSEEYGLPHAWSHNDAKLPNFFMQETSPGNVEITSALDFQRIGLAPRIKTVGRTLAFMAFDQETGEFYPERAEAVLTGYLERCPLTEEEQQKLGDYVKYGLLQSFAARVGYFADDLQGEKSSLQVERINPALHLQQLESFENWNSENRLAGVSKTIQEHVDKKHHQITEAENRFIQSDDYLHLRENGQLSMYFQALENAHAVHESQLRETLTQAMDRNYHR